MLLIPFCFAFSLLFPPLFPCLYKSHVDTNIHAHKTHPSLFSYFPPTDTLNETYRYTYTSPFLLSHSHLNCLYTLSLFPVILPPPLQYKHFPPVLFLLALFRRHTTLLSLPSLLVHHHDLPRHCLLHPKLGLRHHRSHTPPHAHAVPHPDL